MCKDKIKKCIVQFGGKFQFIDSVQFAEAQQAFVFDKKTIFSFTEIILGGKWQVIDSNITARKPFCFLSLKLKNGLKYLNFKYFKNIQF